MAAAPRFKGIRPPYKWKPERRKIVIDTIHKFCDEQPPFFNLFPVAAACGNALNERWSQIQLNNLAEMHTDVQDAVDYCKSVIADHIIKGAMVGDYSTHFARFVLSFAHGMVEPTAPKEIAISSQPITIVTQTVPDSDYTIVD